MKDTDCNQQNHARPTRAQPGLALIESIEHRRAVSNARALLAVNALYPKRSPKGMGTVTALLASR